MVCVCVLIIDDDDEKENKPIFRLVATQMNYCRAKGSERRIQNPTQKKIARKLIPL